VRGDQVAIVDLLIHAGAQVNVADRYGVMPSCWPPPTAAQRLLRGW
jgi:hypothetical protein